MTGVLAIVSADCFSSLHLYTMPLVETASNKKPFFLWRWFSALWRVFSVIYKVLIIFSVVMFGLALWAASKGGAPIVVEDNIALVLAPSGDVVEQIDVEPGSEFFAQFSDEPPAQTRLRDLIDALDEGAKDSRIKLAVFKLDYMGSVGLAQLEELSAAMQRFRKAGKRIEIYERDFDQYSYYLAAHADAVSLDPQGGVLITGLGAYQNYFKEALDKLGVEVNVFRVGEYKSAVEPFIRNDMSAEAKAANAEWLGDLWQRYTQQVQTARSLPKESVQQYVDGLSASVVRYQGDTAKLALEARLVQHVETLQTFRNRIGKIVGMDDDTDTFKQIYFLDYLRAVHLQKAATSSAAKKVALVVVQGEIVDGSGEVGQAGDDTLVPLLNEARRDEDVVAVVLRVDSPGGSAAASEQIRRAVQRLREAGKPVVTSMSSVAASGGYWVAMSTDKILAQPSTITGSIGIFGLIPTFNQPLEKLGIHTDGVGTTTLAGALRTDRPLSPEVKALIQAGIEKGYRDFIQGVAAGRKLKVEQVDSIARGRVWSGEKAKAIGLVDQFGGLQEAVKLAASLAKVADYELDERQPQRSFNHTWLAALFGSKAHLKVHLESTLLGVQAPKPVRSIVSQWQWLLTSPQPRFVYCAACVGVGRKESP
jgi:protease-4